MLLTKFCGNRPSGSGGEDFFKDFYHVWAWWPSWSCDQHHIKNFISMYLKSYIQNLVKNGPVVSEKSMF